MCGGLVLAEARGELLCASNVTVPVHMEADKCDFTAVLMILMQLGAGLGAIALLSLGISYLDDNVEKRNSASLIGKTRLRLKDSGKYTGTQYLWLMDLTRSTQQIRRSISLPK